MITITLVALAAVNAIVITWATALDARHASALARALGATPQQVSAGLSAAQVLPALVGAILGIPGGIALFAAVGDSTDAPAALAAARRRAGDRPRRRGAHGHTCAHRRPPPRRRDPPVRTRLVVGEQVLEEALAGCEEVLREPVVLGLLVREPLRCRRGRAW